jgi:hypothetical protein
LKVLRNLNQVKFIHLDGTQITDACLIHLQDLTDLELLSIRGTQITSEAKTRLRRKLPRCLVR